MYRGINIHIQNPSIEAVAAQCINENQKEIGRTCFCSAAQVSTGEHYRRLVGGYSVFTSN